LHLREAWRIAAVLSVRRQPEARFQVLLTQDRPRGEEAWFHQLTRLLEPQGVRAFVARSGREAIAMAAREAFHAAVIDLGTPPTVADDGTDPTDPLSRGFPAAPGSFGRTELWLLELLQRLPNRPPVVVLRQPAISRAQAERILGDALRLGAFSVLDKPVNLEQVLATFRRLVERQYRGQWPVTES
jgi:CheY-like chemotaxis protein